MAIQFNPNALSAFSPWEKSRSPIPASSAPPPRLATGEVAETGDVARISRDDQNPVMDARISTAHPPHIPRISTAIATHVRWTCGG